MRGKPARFGVFSSVQPQPIKVPSYYAPADYSGGSATTASFWSVPRRKRNAAPDYIVNRLLSE